MKLKLLLLGWACKVMYIEKNLVTFLNFFFFFFFALARQMKREAEK